MQFITAKKDSDVVLHGVQIEIERRNGSPFAVTFRSNGNLVKISQGQYSNFEVLVPAPPTKVERFRLSGKFGGLVDVCEDFETEWQANERLREYGRKFQGPDDDCGLSVEKVEVEEAA
jgi:hypothetical protein